MNRKLVKIVWKDAKTWSNDWMDEEDRSILVLPEYTTYGIVIKEDVDSLFVAQTVGDECRNIIGIHRGSITDVKVYDD
jgi:hypothetical protein